MGRAATSSFLLVRCAHTRKKMVGKEMFTAMLMDTCMRCSVVECRCLSSHTDNFNCAADDTNGGLCLGASDKRYTRSSLGRPDFSEVAGTQ